MKIVDSLKSYVTNPYRSLEKNFRAVRRIGVEGQEFQAQAYELTRSTALKLGINPCYVRNGLGVFYLGDGFDKFAAAMGFADQGVQGFYPLQEKGESTVRQIYEGKLDYLPPQERAILIRGAQTPKRALTHEVLHDVFIGGGIDKLQRVEWILGLPFWMTKAIKNPERREEAAFYEEVSMRCAKRVKVEILPERLEQLFNGERISFEGFVFVGECFAYGGELFLGYPAETEGVRLPREIASRFSRQVCLKA